MQAFGLLVVDLDGAKISELASQLSAQGFSVASASVSASDPQPVAAAEPAAAPVEEQAAAAAETTATDTADAADAAGSSASEPDNTQPFKCPACGRTFDVQVTCLDQHDPTLTLPTADVLAGAPPAPADESAATPEAEPAVASAADETPPAADEPSGAPAASTEPAPTDAGAAGDPSEPAWPAS